MTFWAFFKRDFWAKSKTFFFCSSKYNFTKYNFFSLKSSEKEKCPTKKLAIFTYFGVHIFVIKHAKPLLFRNNSPFGSLRSPLLKKESNKKWEKKSEKIQKKSEKFQKIVKKFLKFFFSIFPKFFSVEIFHMQCRLRIQNFMTLGQTVPEIQGVTDIRTNLISNKDLAVRDKGHYRWQFWHIWQVFSLQ